jgi:hypothetical protein
MPALTHGHRAGHKRSPTYISWDSMIARCHRPSHPRYADYGGRGIRVCDRWRGRDGFVHFLGDVGERNAGPTIDRSAFPPPSPSPPPPRPAGLTIDRIDVNGNYEPGNVKWSTLREQRWNRRDMVDRSPAWETAAVVPVRSAPTPAMPF